MAKTAPPTRFFSWNVNGIRAAHRTGFLRWMEEARPDVLCLQEIKATPEVLEEELRHPLGKYHAIWHPAEKPGYSGVAIYSRQEPTEIRIGMGVPSIDREGRVLVAEFGDLAVASAYFPNSQRDHARLPYKLAFCEEMLKFCRSYEKRGMNLVLCGDFNIAHREIDLRNPKQNQDNAGFLPEERAWMDRFLDAGWVDVFRRQNPELAGAYTWWSYRPGVREKNVGWRLDYHVVNADLFDRAKKAEIHCEVRGSDHCPVSLELKR
jgi:exodeoxyribonuclease-3